MAAKEEGYDVSRFVGEVKEHILCSICQAVPKDPRLCKNKDHFFCLAHISQHLHQNSQTCPVCGDPLTLETLRRPTGFLKNYLDDLQIKCDHHDRGCPDVVRLEDLPRHVDQCGYAPVKCGNEGCEIPVNKRDKENHERSVCQFRIARWHEIEASQDEVKTSQNEIQNDVREIKRQIKLLTKMFSQVADQRFSNLLSSNKEVIIMGGRNNNGVCKSVTIFNDFNPAKGTYAQLPPMNSPRQAASSCVYNNDVIIAGGHDGRVGLDTIEILKINQDPPQWTISHCKLPCWLSSHVIKVYQEKLLAIGGFELGKEKVSNEIHELTLTSPHTTTLLTTMPQPRLGHTAEIVNDKLFILGGMASIKRQDGAFDSVMMYDFITKQFTTCPPLPKPVYSMSTVTWGNKIIITGGRDSNHHCINDVIMYDTETGRSERLPSMNNNRSEHVAVTCDDVIVVLGGCNEEEGHLDSVESWKIDSDENWKELPAMLEKRGYLTAVVKP